MPRVLRIINRFNLGGPTYNVGYLTKYLPSEFETILVGGPEEATEGSSDFILQSLGLKATILPSMQREIGLLNDYKAYSAITKIIKEFKPDIVHTHASKAGTLGRLAAAKMKVPVVVHTFHGHVFHSYFSPAKTKVFKQIERYLAHRTDAIIAISEKQKQELVVEHKIGPEEKFKVVPLGFDLSRFQQNNEIKRQQFRKKYSISEDEIALCIVGRLVPVKNHRLFLDIIAKVIKQTSQKIKVFVVGDGELRSELENYCQVLGLTYSDGSVQSDVIFTSWIKDVDRVYSGCDVVLLTSFNEGTPVSLIEAQAANKPIFTTRVGGIENIVNPQGARLYDVNDSAGFVQGILDLVKDPGAIRSRGSQGWDFVSNKFHYTRLVSDMTALYWNLLKKKAPKGILKN